MTVKKKLSQRQANAYYLFDAYNKFQKKLTPFILAKQLVYKQLTAFSD